MSEQKKTESQTQNPSAGEKRRFSGGRGSHNNHDGCSFGPMRKRRRAGRQGSGSKGRQQSNCFKR